MPGNLLIIAIALAAVPAALLAAWLGLSLPLRGVRDFLVFLVLAPLLEEWVFRQQIQQAITNRYGRPHLANLLASLLFMCWHWQQQGPRLLLWMLPALVLGELWRRHRHLGLNMAMHAWFNLCLWLLTMSAA